MELAWEEKCKYSLAGSCYTNSLEEKMSQTGMGSASLKVSGTGTWLGRKGSTAGEDEWSLDGWRAKGRKVLGKWETWVCLPSSPLHFLVPATGLWSIIYIFCYLCPLLSFPSSTASLFLSLCRSSSRATLETQAPWTTLLWGPPSKPRPRPPRQPRALHGVAEPHAGQLHSEVSPACW